MALFRPALTPDFCLSVVVSSTPSPKKFELGVDDPSMVTLFDMDVVDPVSTAMFVSGVKNKIFAWHINDSAIASSRATTLQAAADSIPPNAF